MNYVNFDDGDGYAYDGVVTAQIDGYDPDYGRITDMTASFTLWKIKSASGDVSLSGSMRMQISSQNRSDVLTVNMDGRDNNAGDTFRFQNFVVMTTYTTTTYSSSASESYNGRVCIARYGCVDVTTTNPFIYTVNTQENPDSGGPVVLSGAGNSRAAITPLTTSFVKIEVDAEGDSLYESRHV